MKRSQSPSFTANFSSLQAAIDEEEAALQRLIESRKSPPLSFKPPPSFFAEDMAEIREEENNYAYRMEQFNAYLDEQRQEKERIFEFLDRDFQREILKLDEEYDAFKSGRSMSFRRTFASPDFTEEENAIQDEEANLRHFLGDIERNRAEFQHRLEENEFQTNVEATHSVRDEMLAEIAETERRHFHANLQLGLDEAAFEDYVHQEQEAFQTRPIVRARFDDAEFEINQREREIVNLEENLEMMQAENRRTRETKETAIGVKNIKDALKYASDLGALHEMEADLPRASLQWLTTLRNGRAQTNLDEILPFEEAVESAEADLENFQDTRLRPQYAKRKRSREDMPPDQRPFITPSDTIHHFLDE